MPMARYEAHLRRTEGRGLRAPAVRLDDKDGRKAQDGVSCSVCHQISKEKLGTRESFNGGFVVDPPDSDDNRPEYGPFEIEKGHTRIMRTSSEGFQPDQERPHPQVGTVRHVPHAVHEGAGPGRQGRSANCPSRCRTRSGCTASIKDKQSCQSCHMPVVKEQVPITRVLGEPREGCAAHVRRRELLHAADAEPLSRRPRGDGAAAGAGGGGGPDRAVPAVAGGAGLGGECRGGGRPAAGRGRRRESGGHKLPTAYPSRRAWLHVRGARCEPARSVFESGAVHADGSIEGNDNDADAPRSSRTTPRSASPTRCRSTNRSWWMRTARLTTGLLTAVRYVKDNRLLPHGFDKQTADKDIAVLGDAAGGRELHGRRGPGAVLGRRQRAGSV